MIDKDKMNPNNWTAEETDRVTAVFEWLLKQDKKQNPDLYKNLTNENYQHGKNQVVKNSFGEDITL